MGSVEPFEFALQDGSTLTVRPMAERDAEAVLACLKAEAGSSPHIVTQPDEVETDAEKEREQISGWAEAEGELALGAFLPDGRCVATLVFKAMNRRRVRHRGMFGIGVLPAYQGQGLGRAMIQRLLDWARGHPFIEVVELGVYETNTRARALYEQLGFEFESVSKDFFRVTEPDGKISYVDNVTMTQRVKIRR